MTKAERRAAFPRASATWHRLHDAFERGESRIEIDYSASTYPDLDLAIKAKLCPELYPFKPSQRLKKAATLALRDATRTRRPTTSTDRDITNVIDAVVKSPADVTEIVDQTRREHYRRPLTTREHLALVYAAQTCRSRTDWRAVLTPWLKCP